MNTRLDALMEIARETAADLVIEILEPSPYKRRLVFRDKSFMDLYFSVSQKNVYAFHYERRHHDGTLYRVDNYPHHRTLRLQSYPHHWHEEREGRSKRAHSGPSLRTCSRIFSDLSGTHFSLRTDLGKKQEWGGCRGERSFARTF